jgi:cyclohexanone monooxygenase
VRVYDAAGDVGGTWYWTRYPGAGSDSDSTVYCFSERFSPELLREWEWSERYPKQAEIQRYLRWVTDRLGLAADIRFNTRIKSAVYDAAARSWTLTSEHGEQVSARFFIPAIGALSKPLIPRFPGLETFAGKYYHTARLPLEGLDYKGKRVAVIGSGATAVQIVPELARVAAQVWEFQRSAYHSIPARNHKLDADDWREIHAHHQDIWARARRNFAGFPFRDFLGPAADYPPQEQQWILEKDWQIGGFASIFSGFSDVLTNRDSNQIYMDFLRRKVHEIVHDPKIADRLLPKEPIGSKRPPLEHGYYAAFNRDNVGLVDMKETPIEAITPRGIRTCEREYEVDIILFATGFDAFTGSLLDIDIRGRDGQALRHKWSTRIDNYLGLMVHGFPNLFMLYCGPYNPAILINGPTLIEQQGEWILQCIKYMQDRGYASIEPQAAAEQRFVAIHEQIAQATLIPQTASWWTGTNVEGKPRTVLSWCGGFPEYRRLCDESAAAGYADCTLEPG